MFKDQANGVVSDQADLNIKMVVGLGDIVDGGYPIDNRGNVNGICATSPPSPWPTQWQKAQAAINVLTSHGIYYQPTIGNHDYDCQTDRPQPRGHNKLLPLLRATDNQPDRLGAQVSLTTPGLHRVAGQTYDNTRSAWVKSVIYVTNP